MGLANYCDDDGQAWPRLETLAHKLGLSKPTVIENIKRLVNKELVTKEARQNKSSVYCLIGVKKLNPRGKETLPGGLRNLTSRGKETLLNPLLDPLNEPSFLDIHKNEYLPGASKNSVSGNNGWPPDWVWLKTFVENQKLIDNLPTERFLDFHWWDKVSYCCGGLAKEFLEVEFAKMGRWIMDNKNREPTPRGYRRFVAGWLERSYNRERRVKNAPK